MKNNKNVIPICLAADNNYAQHLGVTLLSVLENLNKNVNVDFHILCVGINNINKEKIKNVVYKYKAKVFFYELETHLFSNFKEINHLSLAAYARLFLPKILTSDIEKIIYLDSDTIVLQNIGQLYDIDVKDYALASVRDVMSSEILRIFFYPGLKKYFNSGVMLINLKKWKDDNLLEKSIEFAKQYNKYLLRADQDILNCIYKDSWKELPEEYNLDLKRKKNSKSLVKNAIILHYSDRIKPWHYLFYGDSKDYYWYYLKQSPWKDYTYPDKNYINIFKKPIIETKKRIKSYLSKIIPNRYIDQYRKKLWSLYKSK
jgi:lipopolysaccharide biosynthesis glycosyltransferase